MLRITKLTKKITANNSKKYLLEFVISKIFIVFLIEYN